MQNAMHVDALMLKFTELPTRGDAGLLLGKEAAVEFIILSFLDSRIY